MKRFFCLLLCICVIPVMTACGTVPSEEYPYYDMEHSTMALTLLLMHYPDTLDELEEYADYIVKGVVTERSLYPRDGIWGIQDDIISTLKITQVYRGDFADKTEIQINEGCFFKESDPETLVSVYYNMPSEIGKEYLFFLGKNPVPEDEFYYLSVYETGRYPVIDPTLTSAGSMTYQQLYLSHDMRSYRRLYAEVIEKYM